MFSSGPVTPIQTAVQGWIHASYEQHPFAEDHDAGNRENEATACSSTAVKVNPPSMLAPTPIANINSAAPADHQEAVSRMAHEAQVQRLVEYLTSSQHKCHTAQDFLVKYSAEPTLFHRGYMTKSLGAFTVDQVHSAFAFLCKQGSYSQLGVDGGLKRQEVAHQGNSLRNDHDGIPGPVPMMMKRKEANALKANHLLQSKRLSTVEEAAMQRMVVPGGNAGGGAPRCMTRVSMGCPVLDAALQGGLHRGRMTEIAGVAGSGKTQFALQLALHCIAQNPVSYRVVYLVSEDVPHERMDQLAKAFAEVANTNRSGNDAPIDHMTLLQGLLIRKVSCEKDIVDALEGIRGLVAHQLPQGAVLPLVVLDSIAAALTFHTEVSGKAGSTLQEVPGGGDGQAGFSASSQPTAKSILSVGAQLSGFADQMDVALVVLNQVRQRPGMATPVPALGVAWQHACHTKVMLSIPPVGAFQQTLEGSGPNAATTVPSKRLLTVTASPFLPQMRVEYVITGRGVTGYQ